MADTTAAVASLLTTTGAVATAVATTTTVSTTVTAVLGAVASDVSDLTALGLLLAKFDSAQ